MHELAGIPTAMDPWNMRLDRPVAGPFGEYVLVECEQATIETHHQVEVLDENERPLRGVWVIFGYPGGEGPNIDLQPRVNHWRAAPSILRGNAQRTNAAGYAEHTFGEGGEDIWVWDVDDDDALYLPSPIVRNCSWLGTPIGRFNHTGVKLTFQRRRAGVVRDADRLTRIEARLEALELAVGN